MTPTISHQKLFRVICFALAVVTFAVFVPAINYDFVNYDDTQYVIDNEIVQNGLTWDGLVWAFTTGHAGNWHPMTWISHMLDCQIYGNAPGGHHLTNILFHVANTLLLFRLLVLGTGLIWRSAFVAALFALHPLHIESVAWISERKDVLSSFFMMLSILFYFRYAKSRKEFEGSIGSRRRQDSLASYFLTLLFFSFGLLSKPMLVTLPMVFLLLDFWPLARVSVGSFQWNRISKLLIEKWPFFLLSALSCVVTYFAQKNVGAVSSVAVLSLTERISNALVAYVKYLALLFWPTNLAVLYPIRNWNAAQAISAGCLLLLITVAALRVAGRRPYFVIGWFWFLGILVPVIGLVQVGLQSMADRYSYIPSIGVFILAVWGIAEFCKDKRVLGMLGVGAIVICGALTSFQLPYWQDSLTLFQRAIAVTEQNYVAQNNVACAYRDAGQLERADAHFREAIRIKPDYAQAFYNLGNLLLAKGETNQALRHLFEAIRIRPGYALAHLEIGKVLTQQEKFEEAIQHYQIAQQARPKDWKINYNLANAFFRTGFIEEAISQYEMALKANPQDPLSHNNLATALQRQGRLGEAAKHLQEAIHLKPNYPEAYFNLALVRLRQGNVAEAIDSFQNVVRWQPENEQAHFQLGKLFASQNRLAPAIEHLRATLKLNPDSRGALNFLARILACSNEAQVRNGQEAVKLAMRLCEITESKDVAALDTLGAAHAETGNFEEAIRYAERAKALATGSGETAAARQIEQHIQQYQSGKPLREF